MDASIKKNSKKNKLSRGARGKGGKKEGEEVCVTRTLANGVLHVRFPILHVRVPIPAQTAFERVCLRRGRSRCASYTTRASEEVECIKKSLDICLVGCGNKHFVGADFVCVVLCRAQGRLPSNRLFS
jgi:hypothetical protein